MINGKIKGLDIIPHKPACKALHSKLVKSYAIDAILDEHQPTGSRELIPNIEVQAFLEDIKNSEEKKHNAVGTAFDCRYKGDKVVGSALVSRREVLHMSFFRTDE
jgi:hypothetical protein